MTKFKKSASGKKALAFEGDDEQISMLDGKTTYKIKKGDLLEEIKKKLPKNKDKKKAIVSMLTPEGGEVMMELENVNGDSSDFKFEKWKPVKRQLSEEEVNDKITYPIGINKKVADDDKSSDKAAKKFFENLEDSEKNEISKKEINMKNIIETSEKGTSLSPEEKRKMKEQARRDFEKEKQIIKKKKEAAFRDMLAQADKCQKYIPDTVKFVKEKMQAQSSAPTPNSPEGTTETK